jgi:hypothetical protein
MITFVVTIGIVWLVGSIAAGFGCWLLARESVVIDDSGDDDADQHARIESPGVCCDEYFTPTQRTCIMRWIREDASDSPQLMSFARQLEHMPQHHLVPVYWGQVRPLIKFLDDRGILSMSRRLQEHVDD